MAFNHHNNHHHHHTNHQYTTPSCHCQQPPCHSHHPPPSPLQYDPLVISTIVSQILHSQTQTPPPNLINNYQNHNETQPSLYSSLLNRIHKLETTLNHFSSSSSSYSSSCLKDVAARVIQTRFRKFLVRRSKTLRELKQLANVKSNISSLKSGFSRNGVLDFDYVSHKAFDLLLLLDSLKGEDKMIRDSKKSITREIYQFLEMIDEVCLKRHQVMTKKIRSMRLVRNDNHRSFHDIRGHSEHGGGSKSRNVDNEEKKLIANLRKRVERIGKMSRELEGEEEEVEGDESEGFEHLGDEDSGYFNLIRSKYSSNNKSWSHAGGSNGQNVDNEGNRMMANLRERVEKIGKMSRALEEEEVVDDSVEDGGGNFNRIRSKYGPNNGVTNDKSAPHVGKSNGQNVDDEENRMMASLRKRVEKIGKMSGALEEENVVDDEYEGFGRLGDERGDTFNHIRSVSPSNGKKRVCFLEDGNMIRGHNVDGDKIATRDIEEIEDFTNGGQDDDEARSDGHPSTESSEDVSSSSRTYEAHGNEIHNEFTFPAPRPGMKIAK